MLFFIFLSSCRSNDVAPSQSKLFDEQDNPVNIIWIQELNLNENDELVFSFIKPLLYSQVVVTPSTKDDGGDWSLLGLNINSGDINWEWNSLMYKERWSSDIDNRQSDHILIEFENEFDKQLFYAIDLEEGETIWKEERAGKSSSVEPFVADDYYYFAYRPAENTLRPVFYRGNLMDNGYEELFVLPIDSIRQRFSGELGGFSDFTYNKGSNGNEYLFIPYFEYQVEDTPYPSLGFLYVGLYNLTTNDWTYPKLKLREYVSGFNSSRPVIYDDRIAVVNFNNEMIAIDLYSGEEIWSAGPYDQGQFEYILVNTVVVMAPYIGANPIARGLNVETGNQVWQMPSGGGASHLSELNGVVYWKDGGNGDLYAVDAKTGEKYWQLDDPDPESDYWWKSDGVAVLQGENGESSRIFASSHKRMYCLEAVR